MIALRRWAAGRRVRWLPVLACLAAGPGGAPTSSAPVLENDWKGYANTGALRAARLFWSPDRAIDANDLVDLVADPTFGQVARIRQPVSGGFGVSPEHRRRFPAPLDRVWFRFRMKYSPGWTTVGPTPAGHNNAYKIAFILWSQGVGSRMDLVLANTRRYMFGMSQRGVTYREIRLGSPGWYNSAVTTEWTGGEWWEFVLCYERLAPDRARARFWRRQLTAGGRIVDNAFDYDGWEYTAVTGAFAPAAGIALGVNKNKGTPVEQFISWGPYEVVDGSVDPNPFHLPRVN